MADKCKECGCVCKQCNKHKEKHNDMHLHEEIESLRQCLAERDNHIVTMETHFLNEAEKFPNGEMASLKEEILIWEDKYTRLYEAHKRVQKVNQNLEDKLLKIVDKCETEKSAFTKDIATLSHRLAEANYTIHQLTQDNEKYRNDVNLAIQLLQCKPSNFMGQKYEALPPEVQAKVKAYVSQKGPNNNEMPSTEIRSITVPISTFPPTAMVYNIAKPVIHKQDFNSDDDSKPPVDTVSAAIMAKILEDREKDRIFTRHCNTCTCHRSILKVDTECQTTPELNGSAINSTKDYFSKCDNADSRNAKNSRPFLKTENREVSYNYNKGRSQLNDINLKTANFYSVNESTEKNGSNVNNEKSKLISNCDSNEKIFLNSRNSYKNKNMTNGEKKVSKERNNLDDQAKLDVINERLWKNSWTAAKITSSTKESSAQLDVINERTWRHNHNNNVSNNNKIPEKPVDSVRLTVIEVHSSDDLTNQSEKTQTSEPTTTSPSFSGDSSILVSSSDPSSLSSDVGPSGHSQQQQLPASTTTSNSSRKERPSGPRNCLMRVTPGSKNVLLDNVGAYQTVLYTSGCSRPSTALVHVGKSSRSGRSASMSSEENDATHLQRVAQWVDTLAHNGNPQLTENASSSSPVSNAADSGSQDPLLLDDSSARVARQTSQKRPPNQLIPSTSSSQLEEQRDLMSFEGLSDEEHKLSLELEQQDNISKQVEETYAKLAADLGCASRRTPDYTEIDMMTIEKYRKEQKRLQKASQAKFASKT